jgi:hypothetical protein
MSLEPPITPADQVDTALTQRGFAVLDAHAVGRLLGAPVDTLDAWPSFWNDLPADAYLRDGGRYRRRRHGCFVVEGDQVTALPPRPHWQPVEYNALHGGLERHFEPLPTALTGQPAWGGFLRMLAARASALKGAQRWYVEAHAFRIDTTDGIGRPTPEGAHRDGVDLVAVTLVARSHITGGETRVFAAHSVEGLRFTLTQPWSTLLLDDARVIHESTPIQPERAAAEGGHRDTLVVTLRAGGFQGPGVAAN